MLTSSDLGKMNTKENPKVKTATAFWTKTLYAFQPSRKLQADVFLSRIPVRPSGQPASNSLEPGPRPRKICLRSGTHGNSRRGIYHQKGPCVHFFHSFANGGPGIHHQKGSKSEGANKRVLGLPSMSILSRDPNFFSGNYPTPKGKQPAFERTMVGDKEPTPRGIGVNERPQRRRC